MSEHGVYSGPYFLVLVFIKSSCSVQIWENMDKKKLRIWILLTQCDLFSSYCRFQTNFTNYYWFYCRRRWNSKTFIKRLFRRSAKISSYWLFYTEQFWLLLLNMICSLFSALFILIGLSVYAGKSGIPFKKPYEQGSFSWSFIIAWVTWVLTIAAAVISFFDDEEPPFQDYDEGTHYH